MSGRKTDTLRSRKYSPRYSRQLKALKQRGDNKRLDSNAHKMLAKHQHVLNVGDDP